MCDMPILKKSSYTIKDIYALPEGERAELIDGRIYAMAPPNRLHQKLVMELSHVIKSYIEKNNGECEVYPSPFAVFLNKDEKIYVEPDISVICDKDKLNDRGCVGAPDFVIEVVSKSSRKMDYTTKNALYSDAGVREYWIVDPEKERTTIYYYEQDEAPMISLFTQTIQSGIYEELEINISELLK